MIVPPPIPYPVPKMILKGSDVAVSQVANNANLIDFNISNGGAMTMSTIAKVDGGVQQQQWNTQAVSSSKWTNMQSGGLHQLETALVEGATVEKVEYHHFFQGII